MSRITQKPLTEWLDDVAEELSHFGADGMGDMILRTEKAVLGELTADELAKFGLPGGKVRLDAWTGSAIHVLTEAALDKTGEYTGGQLVFRLLAAMRTAVRRGEQVPDSVKKSIALAIVRLRLTNWAVKVWGELRGEPELDNPISWGSIWYAAEQAGWVPGGGFNLPAPSDNRRRSSLIPEPVFG